MIKIRIKNSVLFLFVILFSFSACENYYKNDYNDNSPTSGQLKIYHSEGLESHLKNQAYTFSTQYPDAHVELVNACENEIITAFLQDSCKAIMISRLLGEQETKAFDQKNLHPMYSPLAKSGVALITSIHSSITKLSVEEIKKLLGGELTTKDSSGNVITPIAVLDNKCSSVAHYLLDSVLQQKSFGPKCYAATSSEDLIKRITEQPNQIGFVDFAWISDVDSDLFKSIQNKIKFISVGRTDTIYFAPNQSSFKTGEYPFTRTIYFLRRSDNFSLAKGFEAFMAGPKGQLTFLKQGLLPVRQAERSIEVKMEPLPQ